MPASQTPRRILMLISVLAVLAVWAWWATRAKPIAVSVATVEKGTVEKTVANTRAGTVMACRRARLSPGTGGQIAVLDIREGDRVATGTLLLELWNRDLMAEIAFNEAEARATRASARAACLQAEVAQQEFAHLAGLHLEVDPLEDLVTCCLCV